MYSVRESRWLSIERGESTVLAIHVTAPRVVLSILVVQVVLLGTIGLSRVGYDLALLRSATAVIYLTFVPGFLLLRLAGVSPDRDVAMLVYTVGASLATLMGVGVLVNFGLRFVGVARPMGELPLVGAISAIVLALTGIYYYYRPTEERRVRVNLDHLISPVGLGLLLLPPLAVYGAVMLTRFDTNLLLVALYVAIAVIPLLIVATVIPRELYTLGVWTIGLSLLVQNTLTGQFLAWGDQVNEAGLALFVIHNGYWDPALAPHHANKFTMLRLVILHPIYAQFSGLDVVWLFKIIHPLVFSAMPVALYLVYRRYTSAKTAVLSVILYMSLFSFFLVLSRNTRTATALFFLAVLLVALSEDSLIPARRKFLAIIFAAAIVVSHYGVSYIVMLALVLVLFLARVFGVGTGDRTDRLTSPAFVAFYVTVALGWYIYVSPDSKSYQLLLNFLEHFITSLRTEFLANPGSTSATTRYVTDDFNSIIIRVLTLYNFVIGGFIGVGLGTTIWRLFRDSETNDVTPEYLAYAWTFLLIFGITFLPVERFNTARTYATALLVFAPFFIIGVRELWRIGSVVSSPLYRFLGRQRTCSPTGRRIAAVSIVIYFLLNVGLVSVAITHEYSPNVLVEKERVMDSGHPVEKEYFFKQYRTTYDVSSTAWLKSNGEPRATVYSSQWPGNPRGAVGSRSAKWTPATTVPILVQPIPRDTRIGPGYVYLGSFSYIGNIIKFPGGHFEFNWAVTSDVRPQWDHKSKVYANGGSAIYR